MLIGRTTQLGVTLIELLIGIGVFAVLLTVGIPSFQAWLQNAQIRNAADALTNGIQLARTEAVRRNKVVYFALDTGTNWTVMQFNPKQELHKRTDNDGSQTAKLDAGGRQMVTFGPLGAPLSSNPEDGSMPITRIDVTSSVSTDALRPLAILISASGSVRMCDPDPKLPAGDPRRCQQ